MTNEERFAWFVTGWLSLAFIYWGMTKAQEWLKKRTPCGRCGGDGFFVDRD